MLRKIDKAGKGTNDCFYCTKKIEEGDYFYVQSELSHGQEDTDIANICNICRNTKFLDEEIEKHPKAITQEEKDDRAGYEKQFDAMIRMAEHLKGVVNTFCIAFENDDGDGRYGKIYVAKNKICSIIKKLKHIRRMDGTEDE